MKAAFNNLSYFSGFGVSGWSASGSLCLPAWTSPAAAACSCNFQLPCTARTMESLLMLIAGNDFESEALAGALPVGQNNPKVWRGWDARAGVSRLPLDRQIAGMAWDTHATCTCLARPPNSFAEMPVRAVCGAAERLGIHRAAKVGAARGCCLGRGARMPPTCSAHACAGCARPACLAQCLLARWAGSGACTQRRRAAGSPLPPRIVQAADRPARPRLGPPTPAGQTSGSGFIVSDPR